MCNQLDDEIVYCQILVDNGKGISDSTEGNVGVGTRSEKVNGGPAASLHSQSSPVKLPSAQVTVKPWSLHALAVVTKNRHKRVPNFLGSCWTVAVFDHHTSRAIIKVSANYGHSRI